MMMEINHLPDEMLLMVHQRLSKSALKKAVLVSKLWRDVGEDPNLWEWCKVAVYSKEDINNLSIKRLRKIKELLINPDNWDADDCEAFFRAVKEFSSLKKIDGLDRLPSGMDFVEPGLFARSLAKLEDVTVRRSTYNQIEALFTEMSSTTQVKTFHLSSYDLSQMEPGLFARVLSRLVNLHLDVNNVTKDQMQTFFTEIENNNSLKRLVLLHADTWRHLEPRFFARVLSKVEDVSLEDYLGVGIDHLEALFTELSVGTQLKRLGLSVPGAGIYEIEPSLFANALAGLEELRLEYLCISTDQLRALFIEISLRTQMKKLALVHVRFVDMDINLSELDPGLIARVLARLEDVELAEIGFTTDQMLAFFTEMRERSNLKSLKISFVDLSLIDPEVLSKALTRLEVVTLWDTWLTNDQVVSLFAEMSRNTLMKKIDLVSIDLHSVAPEVLASALIRLEAVRMVDFGFTHHQAKAFFREISQNSPLKKLELDLSDVDFTTVDSEDLARAVTNVKDVCLCYSNLTSEQITSIFTHVLEGEIKLRKLNISGIRDSVADVNPEIVRKVKDKLKGELKWAE